MYTYCPCFVYPWGQEVLKILFSQEYKYGKIKISLKAHLVVGCDIQRHDPLQKGLAGFVVGEERVSVDVVQVT